VESLFTNKLLRKHCSSAPGTLSFSQFLPLILLLFIFLFYFSLLFLLKRSVLLVKKKRSKIVSELKDNWFYIYLSFAVYFLYKTFVLLVVDKAINLKLTYLNIIISLFSFGNVHVS
jgi:hypothetical protein